jgi:hypothetical protein
MGRQACPAARVVVLPPTLSPEASSRSWREVGQYPHCWSGSASFPGLLMLYLSSSWLRMLLVGNGITKPQAAAA